MSDEKSIQISLSKQNAIVDPYWLHMEVKADGLGDGLTVAEAAGIIDSVYLVKPCLPPEEQTATWDQADGSEEDAKQRFSESIDGYWQVPTAGTTAEGLTAYKVTIKIFRSHRSELYKLQIVNGTAGLPRKKTGKVVHTIDVKGQSHTFDNPIISSPVVSWQGIDGPKIHILGNTIYWDGEVEGTLRAEFRSEWNEVDITVTGDSSDKELVTGTSTQSYGTGWYSGTEDGTEIDDYQNVQCSVLAFYHYQYEELILNRPEKDTSTPDHQQVDISRFITETTTTKGDDEGDSLIQGDECRQHINETIICECDGEEETLDYYEVAPCPPGYSEGSSLPGSRERTTYSDCGRTDEVSTNEFYTEKCCEDWPFDKDMPKCKTVVKEFRGYCSEDDLDKSSYPADTVFIPVGPKFGICGELTIEQKINAKNCCEGVSQLYWDYENSATVVSGNGSGEVAVVGGKRPLMWKVRGSGFYTNAALTERDAITTTNSLTVYLSEEACGAAQIYVTDGCSSTGNSLRSTMGAWEVVPESLWPPPPGFDFYDYTLHRDSASFFAVVEIGGYKYSQVFAETWGASSTGYDYWSYDLACVDLDERIAKGTTPSMEELKANEASKLDQSVPQYISNDIFMSLFENGDWQPWVYPSRFISENWEKCANGIICLDKYKYYNSSSPNYRCAISANILLPTNIISIWKWVCNAA